MLAFDPKDRLSMSEILKHPWLQGKTASEKDIIREFKEKSLLRWAERALEEIRRLRNVEYD